MKKTIGITTTVPIEVLIAAGYTPVDLNNIFVSSPRRQRFLEVAERDGFPQNCCAWIKGIYGVCREHGIPQVLGVTTGDCSNTLMLMEVLRLRGVEAIPFAYPPEPKTTDMERALSDLASRLGTTVAAAEEVRRELQECRRLAHVMDESTWRHHRVSGGENHRWLVSTSDFNGDPSAYRQDMAPLLEEVEKREPYPEDTIPLGYIGVPPIYAQELYPYLEGLGARVVYNEVQRQFAMPYPGANLAEQYTNYTYPYSVFYRLQEITAEVERRRLQGIIHYVQAFCHRGIADIIMRHDLHVPILTLEGNHDFLLTHHVRTRLEAFVDMLRRQGRSSGVDGGRGKRSTKVA